MIRSTQTPGEGVRMRSGPAGAWATLLALWLLTGSAGVWAEDQPAAPKPTPAQQQRLRERDRLAQEVATLRKAGKSAEALAACAKMLALERALFGEAHEDVASSVAQMAELHEEREEFPQARKARQKALQIRTQLYGDRDWRVTDARLALQDVDLLARLDPESRRQARRAADLDGQVEALYARGRFREAVPLAQQARSSRRRLLTENHPDYATSLINLAALYGAMGDYAKALPLLEQARDLTKKLLTENHPAYVTSLSALAGLHQDMGDYAQARPLFEQARDLNKKLLTEKHPDYALSLNNLAVLYLDMGDHAQALPLLEQARDLYKKLLMENHPDYANSLNNLALVYQAMGDYAQARPLFEQARDLYKKLVTEDDPRYAASLINLGTLYKDIEKYAQALPLLKQARDLYKKVLTENHPHYATSLNNLALVYQAMGDYAQALPLFEQARDLYKKVLTENHPAYATSLINLGMLYQDMGDYAQAESLLRQSLGLSRRHLELTAAVQSERQQFAMTGGLRGRLDRYLSLSRLARQPAAVAYAEVLAWKGSIFLRQRHLRLARQHPELVGDLDQLDRTTRQLATLLLAVPGPQQQAAYRRRLAELSEDKERLEARLAGRSAAFRQQQALNRLASERVQALLPAEAALVDLLEYTDYPPGGKKSAPQQDARRLVAFVVRPGSLVQVDLGPLPPITAALEAWRRLLTEPEAAVGAGDPAGTLRRLLWDRLVEHLKGVSTVLLSPDGDLSRLPWAALPGRRPGSYLLEDVALAVVPVPQLLPELLAPAAPAQPSLLLVGDVDFGAAPGVAVAANSQRSAAWARRTGTLPGYGPLAGTRPEVVAVRDSFEQRFPGRPITVLHQDQATEQAVRQQAPQHRYLHLATHGFFAPPELRSALAGAGGGDGSGRADVVGFQPGVLSGLVLAGANAPYRDGQDDGILTASEVAALDLGRVELATLSACETGLGRVAGGEGLLGLQRAFQVAGARSVLASLWKVDDAATRELMVRFYELLWQKEKPLGKVAALRQAQLEMLRLGPAQLAMVRDGRVRGAGGTRPADPKATAQAQPVPARTPPYFWAGFVLSGDWR